MHHLTNRPGVHVRSMFSGFACPMARYIIVLVLFTGAGQGCFAQTNEAIKRTAISLLHIGHATQDPHYGRVTARLPEAKNALGQLMSAVTAAESARPGQSSAQFADCLKAIHTATRRTDNAANAKDVSQYGSVAALLSSDLSDSGLSNVIKACAQDLNVALGNDPGIAAASSNLDRLRGEMASEFAQIDDAAAERKAKAEYRRMGSGNSCGNIEFQGDGYVVRSSRIDDPFDFLPWIKLKVERVKAEIAALVDGKEFRYDTAIREALQIIEDARFLPETNGAPLQFAVEMVGVENCADGKLDLVYRIYSTQIMPVLSGTPEARVTERETPQIAAGLSGGGMPAVHPVHLTPAAGYDSTSKLFAGGRLEAAPRQLGKLHFNSIIVDGQGSKELQRVSGALAGTSDAGGWLAHSEWRLNYSYCSLPTGTGSIGGGQLSAQFSGMTRPYAGGNFTTRFGGLLEGGNRQSDLHDVPLAPDTVASTGFGALKLYVGLDSRLPHNVLSFSFGLALGSVDAAARVDWRKQIGDVTHEFWHPLGDHRILSLESRFTFGFIQVPQKIPLSERFFGGSNEQDFIPDDTWRIRANPVIRAIPGSRFFQTADGAGGSRFFSYNLTAAYAVWRRSLMPVELLRNADFQSQLQGSIETVVSTLQNQFAAKDTHFEDVTKQLPSVQTELDNLVAAVTAAQQARPGQFSAEFRACLSAANTASRRARSAAQSAEGMQYGLVQALLSVSADQDEDWLAKVDAACAQDLNASLGNDPAIGTTAASLERVHVTMERDFSEIDQSKAAAQAKEFMVFPKRTLETIFNEVNIYSVSPVFVFDIAKIGPEAMGFGGLRYGPGAGLRLELASTAHFTIGYAWNVRQGPGEGHGTVFFSIGVRDLFR